MTPEERFTKIENALETVADNQAKHDAAIRDLIAVSRTLVDAQVKTDAQIKQTDAEIKELRAAQAAAQARTDAEIKEMRDSQKDLQDLQRQTEEKLNALIDTVDRIIRHQSGK